MDEYNKYTNNHNHNKKNSMKGKFGFYVSLAICITAIGLAVWSTYTSYSDYKEKENEVTATATQANNQVTGVTVEKTTKDTTATTTGEITTTYTTTAENTTNATTATTNQGTSTTLSAVETMLQVTGSLNYPLEDAKILKAFSQDVVYSKTMGDYRSHLGIDFKCKKNSKVLTMADGLVSDIYDDERMGKVLIEDCGSFMIYYSGIDNVKVNLNDSLSVGDVISNVGTIPSEKKDGTHIHIAVRVNGSYVDPLSVISNNQ